MQCKSQDQDRPNRREEGRFVHTVQLAVVTCRVGVQYHVGAKTVSRTPMSCVQGTGGCGMLQATQSRADARSAMIVQRIALMTDAM